MNLRELKSFVYSLIQDPGEEACQFGEVVSYLNIGQSVLASVLWNIEREKFLGIQNFSVDSSSPVSPDQTRSATGDYLCPADLNEIVRVTLNGVECNRHPVRELNALTKNTLYRPVKGSQQFFSEIGDTAGRTKIRIAPVPDEADAIGIWYFKKPTDFHELGSYEGTSTAGSTTTVTCTAAPMIGAGGDDTFWANAEIRLTSGAGGLIGQKRRVTSYNVATGVFTFDALAASAGTNTFELDQVSIIPSQHHHLIGYYAAALAAPKKGMDPQQFWGVWNDHMNMLKRKYQDNVEANVAGDSPAGVRGAAAAV